MSASRSRDETPGREQEILAAAAALFSQKGYSATTVRDIGQRVGLLGGSLYHYIRSKEALFVKLHEMALQKAEDRIRADLDGVADPWARVATACRTLLEIQLDPHSLTMPLMNDFRAVPPDVREQLIVKRDGFEQLFKQLVADLPLPEEVDRGVYRLLLLTILNNSSLWFRPGKLSVEEVAAQIMTLFRLDGGARP
ncbi:MAG: TetR/AcrR family transcriptional regulator [Sphingobium sp.]